LNAGSVCVKFFRYNLRGTHVTTYPVGIFMIFVPDFTLSIGWLNWKL